MGSTAMWFMVCGLWFVVCDLWFVWQSVSMSQYTCNHGHLVSISPRVPIPALSCRNMTTNGQPIAVSEELLSILNVEINPDGRAVDVVFDYHNDSYDLISLGPRSSAWFNDGTALGIGGT